MEPVQDLVHVIILISHLFGREGMATLRTLDLGAEPARDALVVVAVRRVAGQRRHEIIFFELCLTNDAVLDALKPDVAIQNLWCEVQDAIAKRCLLIIKLVLLVEEVADAW